MRNIILIIIFYFFVIFSGYSQSCNITSIWDSILVELNIPKDYCYASIESAISNDMITMEVSRLQNRYDDNTHDFIYTLNFEHHKMIIYQSGVSLKYFLTEVEICINEYEKIKSWFPYFTIDQFLLDNDFGMITEDFSEEQRLTYIQELTYTIEKDRNNTVWTFLKIVFLNSNIDKINLFFRLE